MNLADLFREYNGVCVRGGGRAKCQISFPKPTFVVVRVIFQSFIEYLVLIKVN